MRLREQVQNKIERLEQQLAILNRIPEDTFTFNTVVKLAYAERAPVFWTKVGEERWIRLSATPKILDLTTLIYEAIESREGYFEVYILEPQETPIYASE